MFDAGAAIGRMGLDLSGFERGMLTVNSLASIFPATVTNFIANPLLGVAGIAASVGSALAGMARQGLGMGVQLAADYEQAEVAIGTLLGSADKAKALLKDLSDFAAATPFEFPELQGAVRSLVAFGIAQEDVLPTMRALGDVAAGISQPIGQIAEIYGKARVQGRLFMEDINQLTGRGIPIIQELAGQFGVAESGVRKLVETGKVNFSHLEKAFQNLTGEGGKFAGLMEKQSHTLAGVWSTLKDNVGIAMREVAGSLLDGLDVKGLISGASAIVQGWIPAVKEAAGGVVGWAQAIGSELMPMLPGLGSMLVGVWEVLKGVGNVIVANVVPAMRLLAPIINTVGHVLGFVLDLIGKVLNGLGSVVRAGGLISMALGFDHGSGSGVGSGNGTVNIGELKVQSPAIDDATTSRIADAVRAPLQDAARRQHREVEGAFSSLRVAGGM